MQALVGSNKESRVVLDVLGPTVEFLVLPSESAAGYCVVKGTIPPGVSVPLHSHPDDESFFLVSGSVQALEERKGGFEWTNMNAGDFRHVPGGASRLENQSNEPALAIIVTTSRLGGFFQEGGRPVAANPPPPSPAEIYRFAEVAARYHHWLASPEENAAVGIKLL